MKDEREDNNPTLRAQLENLSWTELKKTAKDSYGWTAPRDYTRDRIISTILSMAEDSGRVKAVTDVNSPPAPGYARIRINKNNNPGGNDPVQITVNNITKTILRDKVVDVPIKFVDALKNAVNDMMVPDDFTYSEENRDALEEMFQEERNYDFSILEVSPGPDPEPSPYETTARNKARLRREESRKFGSPFLTDRRWREATGRPAGQMAL